jgi:hydrogenase maturation factor
VTQPDHCGPTGCITCSDEAVAVRVTALLDDAMAEVDTGEGIETVSVALVEARVGTVVLVHAREAIAVVPPEPES